GSDIGGLVIPNEPPPAYESTIGVSNLDISRRAGSPASSIPGVTTDEDKYAIAPICTSYDHDGIDVYFMNHRSDAVKSDMQAPGGYYNIRDAKKVEELFKSVPPQPRPRKVAYTGEGASAGSFSQATP
ncbi:hypothetical protein ACHAO7_011989, partial [Fusarium culmorum]